MVHSLSILIPVYNYDCTLLVKELVAQASLLSIPYQVLLGDDCSSPSFQAIYDRLQAQNLCQVLRSNTNLGAGGMRNWLIAKATSTHCLIIDSDTRPARTLSVICVKEEAGCKNRSTNESSAFLSSSEVDNEQKEDKGQTIDSPFSVDCSKTSNHINTSSLFLFQYLQAANDDSVICGGFIYPQLPPAPTHLLRYKYGIKVEVKSVPQRQKRPYDNFISMCFLAPKSVLKQGAFHPRIGMGYEDACFGKMLQARGVPILHIDNPVIHDLKETSEQFLATTKRYVNNLYKHRDLFSGMVRLLDFYDDYCCHLRINYLLANLYPLLEGIIHRRLTRSKSPSLNLFSFYKLLYLSYCDKKGREQKGKERQP